MLVFLIVSILLHIGIISYYLKKRKEDGRFIVEYLGVVGWDGIDENITYKLEFYDDLSALKKKKYVILKVVSNKHASQ